MKNFIAIVLLAMVVISCSNDEDLFKEEAAVVQPSVGKRLASQTNVKLYKAWIGGTQRYGFVQQVRRFDVEVANIAYDKEVVIVHKMDDTTWKEYPLSYSFSTSDGSEIWSGEIEINGSYYEGDPEFVGFSNEFAIKYVVDGNEYWDNNNWNNYVTGSYDEGVLKTDQGMMLREGVNMAVNTDFSSYSVYGENGSLKVTADVQNIGFAKEVELVYTLDGWATVHVAPLEYQNSYAIGDYNYQNGVNAYGVERWSTPYISLEETPNTIEYAMVYKVNGQEYWDNNFGMNYTISKKVFN